MDFMEKVKYNKNILKLKHYGDNYKRIYPKPTMICNTLNNMKFTKCGNRYSYSVGGWNG